MVLFGTSGITCDIVPADEVCEFTGKCFVSRACKETLNLTGYVRHLNVSEMKGAN